MLITYQKARFSSFSQSPAIYIHYQVTVIHPLFDPQTILPVLGAMHGDCCPVFGDEIVNIDVESTEFVSSFIPAEFIMQNALFLSHFFKISPVLTKCFKEISYLCFSFEFYSFYTY